MRKLSYPVSIKIVLILCKVQMSKYKHNSIPMGVHFIPKFATMGNKVKVRKSEKQN